MDLQRRKRMMNIFVLAWTFAAAIAAWFLTDGQPPGVHAISPFLGAAAASAVLGLGLAFVKTFLSIANAGKPVPPPKLDPDWRATARASTERLIRYHQTMRRKAWLIGLIAAVGYAGLFTLASRDLHWLIVAPFMFLLVFGISRIMGRSMERFYTKQATPADALKQRSIRPS